MTLWLVIVLYLFFLITAYRRTVVAIGPLAPFLMMLKLPINFPTELFGFFVLCALLLYPIKANFSTANPEPYPFYIPTLFLALSHILSNKYGSESHWYSSFLMFAESYLYPILLWKQLSDEKMLKYFINTVLLFSFAIAFYSLFELATYSNPLIHLFEYAGLTNPIVEIREVRFGLKRLQSFLPMHTTLGYVSALFFLSIGYLRVNFRHLLPKSNRSINALMVILFLDTFFSGARSCIAGFMIGLVMFVNKQYLLYKKTIITIAVIGILALGAASYVSTIFDSFKNTDNVEGSSTEMRSAQLIIVIYYWSQSPIFGNGPGYIYNTVKSINEQIYGAESIWFPMLVDYGAFGVMAFMLSVFYSLRLIVKTKSFALIFIVLAYLATGTMTSLPSIPQSYYLIFILVLVRAKTLSLNSKNTP